MGILLAIVLMSADGVGATAQAAAVAQGFGGTWVLDEARSVLYEGEGGGALTFVVVDEGASLKVTRRRPDSEDSYALAPDGKPYEFTVAAGRYTRTLRREHGELVFQISFTRADDQATMSFTERWSLSDRGRALTVQSVFPGGAKDVKVFVRKDQRGAAKRGVPREPPSARAPGAATLCVPVFSASAAAWRASPGSAGPPAPRLAHFTPLALRHLVPRSPSA